ncbi:MAG: hypothetical protein Kow0013_17620 [Pararhodobacter sp.]
MRQIRSDRASRKANAVPTFWHLDGGAPPPSGGFVALVPGADAPLIALQLPAALTGRARDEGR